MNNSSKNISKEEARVIKVAQKYYSLPLFATLLVQNNGSPLDIVENSLKNEDRGSYYLN